MDLFASRLKFLRTQKNVMQKDVANYLCITSSAYGYYEQGKRTPTFDILLKLADYFNVTTDYLLCKTDIENDNKNNLIETISLINNIKNLDKLPEEAIDEVNNYIDLLRLKYDK